MLLCCCVVVLLCCCVVWVKSKGADMFPNVKIMRFGFLFLEVCEYDCLKTCLEVLFPKAEPITGPPQGQ